MPSLRLASRLVAGLFSSSLVVGYGVFDDFPTPSDADIRRAAAAVVFTGDFGRVDHGLRLLDDGLVKRLYVSGLNPGAGIWPRSFAKQFSKRNPQIANLQRLVDCCVEWGERADNTWQNALDVKCWIARRDVEGPLLLITGREHMARARVSLAAVLPKREIVVDPIEDRDLGADDGRRRLEEYLKYLETRVGTLLPDLAARSVAAGDFAEGCPAKL